MNSLDFPNFSFPIGLMSVTLTYRRPLISSFYLLIDIYITTNKLDQKFSKSDGMDGTDNQIKDSESFRVSMLMKTNTFPPSENSYISLEVNCKLCFLVSFSILITLRRLMYLHLMISPCVKLKSFFLTILYLLSWMSFLFSYPYLFTM